jgi:predicted flap endonuclease-1-like 5' DNA nuclease
VTGAALLAVIALAIVGVVAYRAGVRSASRGSQHFPAGQTTLPVAHARPPVESPRPPADVAPPPVASAQPPASSYELPQLRALAEERRKLFADLADARADVARYRQIVIDIEHNAPPPLLDAPGTPDDLKLIVGIGPVIERMLYQLGIGTYRQIARWSERDIDDFDARLAEFPGRIRRDAWVTQARALHIGMFGTPP